MADGVSRGVRTEAVTGNPDAPAVDETLGRKLIDYACQCFDHILVWLHGRDLTCLVTLTEDIVVGIHAKCRNPVLRENMFRGQPAGPPLEKPTAAVRGDDQGDCS